MLFRMLAIAKQLGEHRRQAVRRAACGSVKQDVTDVSGIAAGGHSAPQGNGPGGQQIHDRQEKMTLIRWQARRYQNPAALALAVRPDVTARAAARAPCGLTMPHGASKISSSSGTIFRCH